MKSTTIPCLSALVLTGISVLAGTIDPRDLQAHVEFLASDELEGRKAPDSKGLAVAARYIEAQFHRFGFVSQNQEGNVIGTLKGRTGEYVLVTAHYDHLGISPGGEIRNGANDNASGVSSMLEIAHELSKTRPRRTIVFIAFTNEEAGMIGSRYYAEHPLFPIEKTVAQINLEQTGRTDDEEGENRNTLNVTGYRYSEVAKILAAAAEPFGVKVTERPGWTDAAFRRSDNEALAKLGVPAHTVSVAYEFPDYHKPGDDWQKLDYNNMAKVTRAAAAGVRSLANRRKRPRWFTPPGGPPAASAPKSGKSPASQPPQPPKPSPEH